MVPGTGIAWLFSRRLGKRGYSDGSIRKISEGIAMVTEAVCLIGVGKILFWRPIYSQVPIKYVGPNKQVGWIF